MSSLEDLCRRVERTCSEAARSAGVLVGQANRLRALAGEVSTLLRGDPEAARSGQAIIASLEAAARACGQCGLHLIETDRMGRAYVAAHLSGSGASMPGPKTAMPVDTAPFTAPSMRQCAADSEFWPPNPDLARTYDHVFSGDVVFSIRNGRLAASLGGKHAEDGPGGAVAATPNGWPDDRVGRASHVSLPAGELAEELGLGDIHKPGFSTIFPASWTHEEIESAIREAWLSPSGTREFHDEPRLAARAERISGFWTGTGGGIPIAGYFDLDSGECLTAYPLPAR